MSSTDCGYKIRCQDYLINNKTGLITNFKISNTTLKFSLAKGYNKFNLQEDSLIRIEAGTMVLWSTSTTGGFIQLSSYGSSSNSFYLWDLKNSNLTSFEKIGNFVFNLRINGEEYNKRLIIKHNKLYQRPGNYLIKINFPEIKIKISQNIQVSDSKYK